MGLEVEILLWQNTRGDTLGGVGDKGPFNTVKSCLWAELA